METRDKEIQIGITGILLKQIDGLTAEQVKPEAELVRDLGADSLDMSNFLFDVEERFGIVITDGEAETVKTVQDAVNLIENKGSGE